MIKEMVSKQTAIEEAISHFANTIVDQHRLSTRDPKSDFIGVIQDLQSKDMEGKLPKSKIKDELKSYDLLQNVTYKRLQRYEEILNDNYRKNDFNL